ncbi:hypothetical protein R1sor_006321 [Riccia sorocarpa]|uniref:RNB domain-containing protein n=1 Tax=Riccia sorocarpa TaxID=122646 RepID=A0ABD3HM68_9MARC
MFPSAPVLNPQCHCSPASELTQLVLMFSNRGVALLDSCRAQCRRWKGIAGSSGRILLQQRNDFVCSTFDGWANSCSLDRSIVLSRFNGSRPVCSGVSEISNGFQSGALFKSPNCQVSYGWRRRHRKYGSQFLSGAKLYHEVETVAQEIRRPKIRNQNVLKAATQSPASVLTSQAEAAIKKGALLEFERESGKIILAVAQKPDGKKNWIAVDQAGNSYSVRPQQITYLVPGIEDFDPNKIVSFLASADDLEDLDLLEVAWEEMSSEKLVAAETLAEVIYSDSSPVVCYAVHRMLSNNQIYFRCKQQGLSPTYEPRPPSQVNELQQKQLAEQKAQKELSSYVEAVKSALQCPQGEKPAEAVWREEELFHMRTEALKAYVLKSPLDPPSKKSAEEVLEAMNLTKNPAVALNVLIGMGVLPLHVNVDLLKLKKQMEFTEDHLAAVKQILDNPHDDPDMGSRKDLRTLKVYTIDSEDTDEIDDGLSAEKLPDGRIKIWVHVADPTRWIPYDHLLSREAELRGTSYYMPEESVPMFPIELAADVMSLKQGSDCCAVSVSVVLHEDGSIAEYAVMNSIIRPTYRMSYDNVAELLLLEVPEEPELYLLAEAAKLRASWRASQGAIMANVPETDVKVTNPYSLEPIIELSVKDQSTPAMQLVAEMMIMCGEAVALFGENYRLSLPYRGQAQSSYGFKDLAKVPDGLCRAFATRRLLGSVDMSSTRKLPHFSLGLPGYVQFTSPIRRFGDLIAHYQIKAHLRGDVAPYTSGSVEAKTASANVRSRDARRLQSSSIRYWVLAYLQKYSKGKIFSAVVLHSLKDRQASIFLVEVAMKCSVLLASSVSVGSEIFVVVHDADPRKDILLLKHV